jgi:hypothetical protein
MIADHALYFSSTHMMHVCVESYGQNKCWGFSVAVELSRGVLVGDDWATTLFATNITTAHYLAAPDGVVWRRGR